MENKLFFVKRKDNINHNTPKQSYYKLRWSGYLYPFSNGIILISKFGIAFLPETHNSGDFWLRNLKHALKINYHISRGSSRYYFKEIPFKEIKECYKYEWCNLKKLLTHEDKEIRIFSKRALRIEND